MTQRPAPDAGELRRFLAALRSVESGGRYDAVDGTSGARGAYQILPSNWPAWADRYLGDRHADWTPANQDRVAQGKVSDLYRWLGDWRRVAAWWLAGGAVAKSDPARWSPTVARYVASVMSRFTRYGSGAGSGSADPTPAPTTPAEPVATAPAPVAAAAPGCAALGAVLLALGAGAVALGAGWPA